MEVLPGIPGSEPLCVHPSHAERGQQRSPVHGKDQHDHRLQLVHMDNAVSMESRDYGPISTALSKETRKVVKQHRRVTSSQAEAIQSSAFSESVMQGIVPRAQGKLVAGPGLVPSPVLLPSLQCGGA